MGRPRGPAAGSLRARRRGRGRRGRPIVGGWLSALPRRETHTQAWASVSVRDGGKSTAVGPKRAAGGGNLCWTYCASRLLDLVLLPLAPAWVQG